MLVQLAPRIPLARAGGGLILDGTGSACSTSSSNAVNIQSSTCSPPNGLCGNHAGGVCPAGDLVILQILLNNTGMITSVLSTQGLDHWFRRASVLNDLGGRMEEWYSTTTRTISNPSIYITETVSGITVATQEFAIAGYDPYSPFDSNAVTPTIATGRSNSMSAIISTNDPQDLIFGFAYGGSGMFSPGPGFSGICLNVNPCSFLGIFADASEYELVTKTQMSSIVSIAQTNGVSWGFIADAVQSALPTSISISPAEGPVGSAVTIRGASFLGVTTVSFCGMSQPPFKIINDTAISTIAPQLLDPPNNQTCHIILSNSAGNSLAVADQFSFLPSVSSVSPAVGGNGTLVKISGSGFVGATAVGLCNIIQPRFTVVNDTQITLIVSDPGLTSSKFCDILVTNSVGKSSSSGDDVFNYVPHNQGAGTSHVPSTSANSDKILYIVLAGLGAVGLISLASVMRRWDPARKRPRNVHTKSSTSKE